MALFQTTQETWQISFFVQSWLENILAKKLKMFFRLQVFTLNFAAAVLLLFFLCLGSQNLGKRYSLDFFVGKSVPLPTGFIIGTSFTLGFIAGGLTSVLTINNDED